MKSAIITLLAAVAVSMAAFAEEASVPAAPAEDRSALDAEVQGLRREVVDLNRDLFMLEEDLLFPASTQVAVFVSMDKATTFRLDSVQIQIDGQPVARHVYSFKELEALKKGGVQRIYTGNTRTGEHQLDVSVAGKLSGKDYAGTQSFPFSKDVGPKLVGVTLSGSGEPSIEIGGW